MYKDTCPKCGAEDALYVTGGTFSTRAPLYKDGYSFADADWVETEDELVSCTKCNATFLLSEVTE